MDDIFRLNGRSYVFVGSGDLAVVAEARLRENAEADGYEVHWFSKDGDTLPGRRDATEFSGRVHEVAALAEERLAAFDGSLYTGPRSFYYFGQVNPYLHRDEYDDLIRVARLARYTGICIGARVSGSVQDWEGVPVYQGRIMSGMMLWERKNPGELP